VETSRQIRPQKEQVAAKFRLPSRLYKCPLSRWTTWLQWW
jgi:hypothetical protein